MAFDGFPLVVGWELTLACNLRCRHCASAAGMPRNQELTLAEALSICDQFPDLLVQEVNLTGGEPLVRPDWFQIAERLQRLQIWTQIVTNGMALDSDTIARMKDVGIGAVGISLDGLEATHDRIRGHEGLFKRVMAGMERVMAAGIPLSVLTAVNALNVHELPSVFALLQSLGINTWQVQPLLPLGRATDNPELDLTEEIYLELAAFVQESLPKAKQAGFALEPADGIGYCVEWLDVGDQRWGGCPAGMAACGITSDGKVKGCLSMPSEPVEGDLRKQSFWSIWFSPDSFAYNRNFSPDDLGPACHGCDMGSRCKGGCSSMSYGSTGRFHNDPYCLLAIQRRSAG